MYLKYMWGGSIVLLGGGKVMKMEARAAGCLSPCGGGFFRGGGGNMGGRLKWRGGGLFKMFMVCISPMKCEQV